MRGLFSAGLFLFVFGFRSGIFGSPGLSPLYAEHERDVPQCFCLKKKKKKKKKKGDIKCAERRDSKKETKQNEKRKGSVEKGPITARHRTTTLVAHGLTIYPTASPRRQNAAANSHTDVGR